MRNKKNHKRVSAVLFDWDITLAHASGINTYSERLQALFHTASLEFTLVAIEEAMRSHQVNTAVLKLSMLPGVPQTEEEITDYYRDILQRLGYVNDDDAFFGRLYHAFAELPLTLYDDTLPMLQQLQQRGVTLGIITNHTSLIRPVIDKYIGNYIPSNHVIISQDIQLYKPAPGIFHSASTQLHVAPTNCLFVGDNLYVDAIGAVTQGSYALGLWIDREPPRKKRPLPDQVHRITSLNQVLDFV